MKKKLTLDKELISADANPNALDGGSGNPGCTVFTYVTCVLPICNSHWPPSCIACGDETE